MYLTYVRATVRQLEQPLLPFALLATNPAQEIVPVQLDVSFAARTQAMHQLVRLRKTWNAHFATLRSDQFFFLCAWSSIRSASARVQQLAGLSLGIARTMYPQRRWLVTRPVWRAGELVAWCEEIVLQEEPAEYVPTITLSEGNMLRLALAPFTAHTQA